MAEISPARTAAFRILSRLHEKPDDQTPLPALLEESGKTLSLRDAALAAEIIYGVLRKEARLFSALRPFLARPEGLPLRLRRILAMAAFERAELHGIPYDGSFGEIVDEPVWQNGELSPMTITDKAMQNEQLALLRALGVRKYLNDNVQDMAKMNTDYRYEVNVAQDKGGQYRRITTEFTFIDAF